MMGRVHSFQSLGALDGPGVRFVTFLQGCPLRCAYCHNPDTWDFEAGTLVSARDVVARAERYAEYLSGVTISGGEPLSQSDFLAELLCEFKRAGFHTALDTSGCVMPPNLDEILDHVDLAILDLKMNSDETYRRYIGMPMAQPLAFLDALEKRGVDVWIRQVIVPGIHDAPGQMDLLKRNLSGYRCVKKIELLPFRKLCLEKYQMMGVPFPFEHVPEADDELMRSLRG